MNGQEKYDWMVFVSCMTYNQALYIEDAMNSFTMQDTNFPFVCAIVDDASTDGEQEVINNYLKEYFDIEDKKVARHEETDDYVLTFAHHKTNLNCYFAVLYLKYNHFRKKSKDQYIARWRDTAKYIAVCEGDDYWIENHKLQRQVDFLDSHPDYMMHFHNAIVRYDNHKQPDFIMSDFVSGDFDTKHIFEKWQLPFASILFRKELYDSSVYKDLTKNRSFGVCLFIAATRLGKVYGLSECLSVYRKNEGGISLQIPAATYIKVEYEYVKLCGDTAVMKIMNKRVTKVLYGMMPRIILGDKDAIDALRTSMNYSYSPFCGALLKFILNTPLLIPGWIKNYKKIISRLS